MLKERMLILFAAVLLDAVVGDPHGLWHPVQGIGRLITALETRLRKSPLRPRTQGVILAVLVPLVTTGIAVGLLALAGALHPWARRILAIIMCCQTLAMKSLRDESMKVYTALKRGDVEGARNAVSMIVGRDTSVLDRTGIEKAAIETVAENCSDGVTAPLLFLLLFGAPGGWFYKAVNTMDSMVGYKNETYREFGTAAAKLDDLVNYIPSRLSALWMIAAAYLLSVCPYPKRDRGIYSGRNAWRIWRRDRRNHASPNSAQTESACAGALGLQLAGDAVYFGTLVKKPTIGDAVRNVETEDIRRANNLMDLTSLLMLGAGCLLLCGLAALTGP